jgi:hypothetical protein
MKMLEKSSTRLVFPGEMRAIFRHVEPEAILRMEIEMDSWKVWKET